MVPMSITQSGPKVFSVLNNEAGNTGECMQAGHTLASIGRRTADAARVFPRPACSAGISANLPIDPHLSQEYVREFASNPEGLPSGIVVPTIFKPGNTEGQMGVGILLDSFSRAAAVALRAFPMRICREGVSCYGRR